MAHAQSHGQLKLVPILTGARIACDIRGAGQAILMLHGIGGNRGQWVRQAHALADCYTIITIDARGYGDSQGPKVEHFADFAMDLLALLDALELPTVMGVGHSMGGRILIEAGVRAPERFGALLLSGAQASYLDHMSVKERVAYITKRMAQFDGPAITREAAAAIAGEVLGPGVSSDDFERLTADFMALRRDGYLAALEASMGWDRRDDISALTMPVEVIGGTLDPVSPASTTRALAKAIGQKDALLLEGVGHMAQIEAADRVTSIISDFAARYAHLSSLYPAQEDGAELLQGDRVE